MNDHDTVSFINNSLPVAAHIYKSFRRLNRVDGLPNGVGELDDDKIEEIHRQRLWQRRFCRLPLSGGLWY